jgi:CspA family cold shock protein
MKKKGTIKWFNPTKGYGFIIPEESGKDLFFHKSDVKSTVPIKEGAIVEYVEGVGKKGPEAKEVTIVK